MKLGKLMPKQSRAGKFHLPEGLKPVAAPKNAALRQWRRKEETPGSGGCHSTKARPQTPRP